MIPSQSLALPGCMLMCNMLSDDYIWSSSKAKPSAFALASRALRSWCPREAASGGGTALPIWRCLLWTLPQNWKSSGNPCIHKVEIIDNRGVAQSGLHILGQRNKASSQIIIDTRHTYYADLHKICSLNLLFQILYLSLTLTGSPKGFASDLDCRKCSAHRRQQCTCALAHSLTLTILSWLG